MVDLEGKEAGGGAGNGHPPHITSRHAGGERERQKDRVFFNQ